MTIDALKPLIHQMGTKERLHIFLQQLDLCMQDITRGVVFDPNVIEQHFCTSDFQILRSLVTSIDDMQAMRKLLLEVPLFTLHISFFPNSRFSNQIVEKIQAHEICFVEIMVITSIVAGAICDFKGIYKDYSLKRSLDEWRKSKPNFYAT